jgi:hypothetical protein
VRRPRHLGGEAQVAQPLPAGLRADLHSPAVAHEAGDLGAGPQPAVEVPSPQGGEKLDPLVGGELRLGPVVPAAVGQPVGAIGVPAAEGLPDGDGRQADNRGHRGRAAWLVAAEEEPNGVPARLLDRVAAGPVLGTGLVGRQVPLDRQALYETPSHADHRYGREST